MSNTKPKKRKKLVIKKTGAGDPTSIFKFGLEMADGTQDNGLTKIGITMTIAQDAPFTEVGYFPTMPAGNNILYLHSFTDTAGHITRGNDFLVSIIIKFYDDATTNAADFDFDVFDEVPGLIGHITPYNSGENDVIQAYKIDYHNAPFLVAQPPNFGLTQEVALHFKPNDETQNYVFLSGDNITSMPSTTESCFSHIDANVWEMTEVSTNCYTLYNKNTAQFLGMNNSGLVWYPSSTSPSSTQIHWVIQAYDVHGVLFNMKNQWGIDNAVSTSYLAASATQGTINLSSNNNLLWYFHNLASI